MPRRTIQVADAAAAASRPLIKLSPNNLERFKIESTSAWEALYRWLKEHGHADHVEMRDMHYSTRVGSQTMKALENAQRARLRDTVRLAKIDGHTQRVGWNHPGARRPTADELKQMLSWSNVSSAPMGTTPDGKTIKGEGLYVIARE